MRPLEITLASLLTLFLHWLTLAAESPQQDAIAPDPAVQSQIERAMRAYRTIDYDSLESARKAFDEQFRLHTLVQWDRGVLAKQLIYYSMHPHSEDSGESFGAVLAQAFISDGEMIEAVLPYLGTSDPVVKKHVQDFLSEIEDAIPYRHGPNYERYSGCLRETKDNPPLPLIEYMYRKAPGEALHTCERAFCTRSNEEHNLSREECEANQKGILWGEHVIADVLWKQDSGFLKSDEVTTEAVEQLEKLSRYDPWWVRLYVAEILRSQPEFQTDGVIAALKEDPHLLVRKTIEQAMAEKKERELAKAEREYRQNAPKVPSRQVCPVVTFPLPSEVPANKREP